MSTKEWYNDQYEVSQKFVWPKFEFSYHKYLRTFLGITLVVIYYLLLNLFHKEISYCLVDKYYCFSRIYPISVKKLDHVAVEKDKSYIPDFSLIKMQLNTSVSNYSSVTEPFKVSKFFSEISKIDEHQWITSI